MTTKSDPRHHRRLRYPMRDNVEELKSERCEDVLDRLGKPIWECTFRDVAEAITTRTGHPWPEDELTGARAAFGSVTGQDLLLGVVQTSILEGTEEVTDNTLGWVERRELPNFLQAVFSNVSEPPRMQKINRGGEAPAVTFKLQNEGFSLSRFACQWCITEEDLLDHQTLAIHARALKEIGRSAAKLVADMVFAVILANENLTADSTPLFHSDHNNVSTHPLSSDALADAMVGIASQVLTDRDQLPSHLNLSPEILLVAPQLIEVARSLARSLEIEGSTIQVRPETRLGTAGSFNPANETLYTGSASTWMVASPARQRTSVLACARNGKFVPTIRQYELGRGQWGFGYDCQLDLAVAATDYRGLFYSDGSG